MVRKRKRPGAKRTREEMESSSSASPLASLENPCIVDLTGEDKPNEGDNNNHSLVSSPHTKDQKREVPTSIHNLIQAYRNEKDDRYKLRLIWSDTPDDELIELLLNDATFVVIKKGPEKGTKENNKRKPVFVRLICRKTGLPFVCPKGKLLKTFKRNGGEDPAAVCFTGIRPKDYFAFTAVKQSTLAQTLQESPYGCAGWKKKIKFLFNKMLVDDSGGTPGDSPIASGAFAVWQLLQRETPCLALISLPLRTKGIMSSVLNACRERCIPYFLMKKNETGLEMVKGDADIVCLRALHSKYKEEILDLIRLCDINCLTGGSIPLNEAEEKISRLYNYLEKKVREGGSNMNATGIEHGFRGLGTESASHIFGETMCEDCPDTRVAQAGNITEPPGDSEIIGRSHDNVAPGPEEVDDARILLEERIAVFEASVEATRLRRKTIDDQLQRAVVSVQELECEVDQLESKQNELRLSLHKQTTLQQDLQKFLEKSEHHLQKLQSPETHLTQDEIAVIVRTGENVSNAMVQTPGNSKRTTEAEDGLEIVSEAAQRKVCEDFRAIPHTGRISDYRLRLFWEAEKPTYSRIGAFVPCLGSGILISSVLSIVASEVVLTDSLNNDGWQHRRQCMWNTCLDVRMILSSPATSSPKTEEGGSQEKPMIDPNIQLCPYELSGECQDEFCAYQHLKERPFGRILPRELLPLPRLVFSTNLQSEDAASASVAGPSTELNKSTPIESAIRGASSMKEQRNELTDAADYLELPGTDAHDELPFSFGHSTFSERPRDGKQQASTEPHSTGWFSHAKLAQSLTSQSSVVAILENMGFSFDEETNVIDSEKIDKRFIFQESFEWMDLTVNCFCVMLHAGRFDISQALLKYCRTLCRKWGLEDERVSVVEKIFLPLIQSLDSLESRMFAYESHGSKDTFGHPLEAQFLATVLCFFLFRSRECRVKDIDSLAATLRSIVTVINDNIEVPEESTGHVVGVIVETVKTALKNLVEQEGLQNDQSFSSLLRAIDKGREIRRIVAKMDFTCVGEGVLLQCMRLFGGLMESASEKASMLLGGTWIVGNVLLGSIESAAGQISIDCEIDGRQTELTDLYLVVDRTLHELQKYSLNFPTVVLLLSPLYAANIALATTLRLYNRAHHKLVSLLSPNSKVALSRFSELLWSQLVQLEALLPTRTNSLAGKEADQRKPPDLSPETRQRYELLVNHIVACGVHAHHVTLANDWNLANILSEDDSDIVFESCLNITDVLPGSPGASSLTEFVLEDHKLSRRQTRGAPLPIYSKIPQSLLLVGSSLSRLTLSKVGLDKLPYHFGSFFNRLEVKLVCPLSTPYHSLYHSHILSVCSERTKKMLDLSRNDLEEIPDSLFSISTLQTLILSHNELSLLPNKVSTTELQVLDLSFNNLKAVPREFVRCQQLKGFHLKGNPSLDKMVWELAAQLPNLHEFNCDPTN